MSMFALLALTGLAAPPAISWQPSLDAALADAAERRRPVFIAVNMDGERANEELLREHYQDERIRRLAAQCASLFASRYDHASGDGECARAGAVTCAQHMAVEKEVRAKYLKEAADGSVIAPEHVFLDPDGKVLLSVPYRVSRGELEWCIVAAVRRVDPAFAWTLSGAARAPRRLVDGGVAEPIDAPLLPPSKKEVEEILDRLKRGVGSGGFEERRADVLALLPADDPRAIQYVKNLLTSRFATRREGQWLGRTLHQIGRVSPPAWWEVVADFVDHDEAEVRREAIVALEQLGEKKAIATLQKRFKAEDEATMKGDVLRALAACDPVGKKISQMVTDQVSKAREPALKAAAVVACGKLEDRDSVLGALRLALFAAEPEARVAAACVAGVRREAGLREDLVAAQAKEDDPRAQEALKSALAALDGAIIAPLEHAIGMVTGSPLVRDRR